MTETNENEAKTSLDEFMFTLQPKGSELSFLHLIRSVFFPCYQCQQEKAALVEIGSNENCHVASVVHCTGAMRTQPCVILECESLFSHVGMSNGCIIMSYWHLI